MLSQAALLEFKEIWRAEFGEDLSDDEAVEEAINLLVLFNHIYRAFRERDVDEYDKR